MSLPEVREAVYRPMPEASWDVEHTTGPASSLKFSPLLTVAAPTAPELLLAWAAATMDAITNRPVNTQ